MERGEIEKRKKKKYEQKTTRNGERIGRYREGGGFEFRRKHYQERWLRGGKEKLKTG